MEKTEPKVMENRTHQVAGKNVEKSNVFRNIGRTKEPIVNMIKPLTVGVEQGKASLVAFNANRSYVAFNEPDTTDLGSHSILYNRR